MKKISLKNLQLDSQEMLTKEQLKNVLGGTVVTTADGCLNGKECTTDADCSGNRKCYNVDFQGGGSGCKRCVLPGYY